MAAATPPRLRRALAGLLLATACKPASTPTPLPQTTGAENVPEAPAVVPPRACADAACWLAAADAAQASGLVDVASACRGHAFTHEPTAARLLAWVDSMRSAGQLRRAQAELAAARLAAQARKDAALVAAIDVQLAAIPPTAPSATPTPGPLSPALREAYTLALAGTPAEAALRLDVELHDAPRPAVLADAASVILDHARGDRDLRTWARGAWARARVQLYEQGASLELVPVDTWMTRGVAWHGGELVLLRNMGALDVAGLRLGLITISAPDPGAPARRLFAPVPTDALALTADGTALIRGEGPRLLVQRLDTGETSPPIAAAERTARILSVGVGSALRTLAVVERSAVLWDAAGQQLARFQLDGTTPTITRAYTGEGTYHHNFLHDDPTWPVSLAITADASTVAVGGSDSRVFVFTGTGQRKHILKFSWDYVEHRHMGGNPDLNQPIALHLVGEHELLAIHNHGDLIRWDLRSGKPRKHFPPDCDLAEATILVNRYAEPDAPRQTPTAEQRRGCGAAQSAAFSPDGRMVATGGIQGVRVRDTGSGAGLAMLVDSDLPDDMLSFAADGTLAMVDLYGAVATWRRDQGLQRRVPPSPSGPVDPTISRDGRVLYFHEGRHEYLWDLRAGQALPLKLGPDERVLAVTADGRRVAVRTSTGVDLRDAATGAVQVATPTAVGISTYAHVSADGHVLLDLQDPRRTLLLIDPQARARKLAITSDNFSLQLSDDGQLLAGLDYQKPPQVWRTATGALVQTLTANTRNVAFSRDGSTVAWLELPNPEQAQTRVHARRIDADAASDAILDLEGWSSNLAVAADGAELLVLLQNGKLWRWRPATGSKILVEDLGLYGINRLHYSDDARLILLAGYGHVSLRRNDDALTPVATVHALLAGGWLAISRSGAVDGSPDASASMITRVTRGDDVQILAGELGWDAAHVDGLVARALTGEDVPPLVRGR